MLKAYSICNENWLIYNYSVLPIREVFYGRWERRWEIKICIVAMVVALN
jgi:hypothetical protein